MAIQKSTAILLSKKDVRETSTTVVFYTRDFGKIKGLIKGARGPQAKFGLYLSEGARYDIVYYEKRKTDVYMVTQCDMQDAYMEIADDLDKRLSAYYILELIDKFTPLEEPSTELIDLLLWALEFMRKNQYIDKAIIKFQLKLLEYAGLLPQLDTCVSCDSVALKDAYFSVRMSGLLCRDCRESDIQASPLSKGATVSIDMIRKQNIHSLGRVTITNNIEQELKKILERFIAYHLGEHLKTLAFVA